MADELKWGWTVPDEENAHGPYETRAEAVEAAQKRLSATGRQDVNEVDIGRCEPATVDDFMPGPEDVLEWINSHAYDNGFSWLDEGAFEFKESEDAFFTEFQALIKKYIGSTGAWQLVDTERIKLTVEPDGQ